MGATYIASDFHLGHRNIPKYRKYINSVEHNTQLILDEWLARIKKRDTVYLLGDIAFDKEHLYMLGNMPGNKILVRGNHDNFVSTHELLDVFSKVEGAMKKWHMWLTHIPIHPNELRHSFNIHGHVHTATIDDPRYMNVCCDNLMDKTGSNFIKLETVRDVFNSGKLLGA